MLVKEFMQTNPVIARPSDSAQTIALKMAEQNIGSVLICEEDGKLSGIITDRDIACKVVARGLNPQSTPASEFMSRNPQGTSFDADLDDALEIMYQSHSRRLPVIDEGRLVGVLSAADLAGAFKNRLDQFLGIEESYIRH
jgi:CBS domain-containing protein